MIHYIRNGNVSTNSITKVQEYLLKLPMSVLKTFSDNEVSIYVTDKILKNDVFINGLSCAENNYIVIREKLKDNIPNISIKTLYHECAHLIDYYSNPESTKYYSEENSSFLSAWNCENKCFFELFQFKNTSDNNIDVVEAFAYLFSYYMSSKNKTTSIKNKCPLLWEQIEIFCKMSGL